MTKAFSIMIVVVPALPTRNYIADTSIVLAPLLMMLLHVQPLLPLEDPGQALDAPFTPHPIYCCQS